MITTDKIELAKQLSKHFHKGQKYGEHDYYTYHVLGVLKTLHLIAKEPPTEEMLIVALLYDVLEDSLCSYDTIENIFDSEIADRVWLLTKNCNYGQYIDSICEDDISRVVKYADSLFNHSECVRNGDFKRAEKYQHNLNVLHSKELFKC